MSKFKAYARYSTAHKHAAGRPIVRIGDLYIVGDFKTYTEVSLLNSNGGIVGVVCLWKLDTGGNLNRATIPEDAHAGYRNTVFSKDAIKKDGKRYS